METSGYSRLSDFITKRMRMSHIYQPVMLRVLLENRGTASRTAIAKALLADDRSQIEYYEAIVRNMPGRVLSSHGIVERDGKDYRLVDDFEDLTNDQRGHLIGECSARLASYIEERGSAPWQHRKKSMGCPSSKQMGLFNKGGSGSSLFDVKPLGVGGSSGGFGWSVF